jgi:hypothetical protein
MSTHPNQQNLTIQSPIRMFFDLKIRCKLILTAQFAAVLRKNPLLQGTDQANVVRKTLIPTVFFLLLSDFLSVKNDVNVASKKCCCHLEGH